MWTYFPVEDHLVSFSVFDLVVEVLGQLQALVYLSLEPDGALSKETQQLNVVSTFTSPKTSRIH